VNTSSFSQQPHAGSLASRAVVGSLVAAGFAALCWADASGVGGARAGWWLMPIALVLAWGAATEAARMAGACGFVIRAPLVASATAILPLVALAAAGIPPAGSLAALGQVGLVLTAILGVFFVIEIAAYRHGAGGLQRIAVGFLTVAAIGLPLAFMVSLRVIGGAGATGLLPLVSMVAVVKGGDIAAYLVGSQLGRHRMAPLVSPGKTWEGAAASVAASLALAWVLLEGSGWAALEPWGSWPVYGLAVGVAGMLGDLSESLVKRELAVKDSGQALGGLGGFLDLVDAPLFAAPVAWLLWTLGSQP
jgi:phosphatidate cytidylyltransferase